MAILLLCACGQQHENKSIIYDIVIENARVIDPETDTDKVLNVGISEDKIAEVNSDKLTGKFNKRASKIVIEKRPVKN